VLVVLGDLPLRRFVAGVSTMADVVQYAGQTQAAAARCGRCSLRLGWSVFWAFGSCWQLCRALFKARPEERSPASIGRGTWQKRRVRATPAERGAEDEADFVLRLLC